MTALLNEDVWTCRVREFVYFFETDKYIYPS